MAQWLIRAPARTEAKRRLVLFPHAGATPMAYGPWLPHLPSQVEVVIALLPARMDRAQEAPSSDLEQIVSNLAAAVRALPPKPTALFGHSLGALLALQTTAALEGSGDAPQVLVVSGMRPPHLLDRALEGEDEEALRSVTCARIRANLWDQLRRLGTPVDTAQDRMLLEPMLPAIRADFELYARFPSEPVVPVRTPLWAFSGTRDPFTSTGAIDQWSSWGPLRGVQSFEGGHFFAQSHARQVVARLLQAWDGLASP